MTTGNAILREQLTWHWEQQLRPRLDGLTDEEYLREPVPGCWSVRPRGTSHAPIQGGSGATVIEFAFPEPDPAPVTTIAWRLGHVIVGVLAVRSAAHFGRAATDYFSFDYAATADEALAQLDAEYATWVAGVASLGEDGLARPCGEAEGPYAEEPLAVLVLHIHREVIHHLAEVCLLRDLYRAGCAMSREVQLTVDGADPAALAAFWAQALGYRVPPPPPPFTDWDEALAAWGVPPERRNDASACVDPDGPGPRLFFQRVPEGKVAKNRLHLDVRAAPGLSGDERMAALEAEAERLVALGAARLARYEPAPPLESGHVVMADPEGNEFCLD